MRSVEHFLDLFRQAAANAPDETEKQAALELEHDFKTLMIGIAVNSRKHALADAEIECRKRARWRLKPPSERREADQCADTIAGLRRRTAKLYRQPENPDNGTAKTN